MRYHRRTMLTLIAGWYLMIPPHTDSNRFLIQLPVAEWRQFSAHDTAADCEDEKARLIRVGGRISEDLHEPSEKRANAAWMVQALNASQCVSVSDPRLRR